MMKTRLLLLVCFLASIGMMAQPPRRKFNPHEFKAKLEAFITSEAGFTPAEAQAFYPIFHEMKAKQRQLQHEIGKLKHTVPPAQGDSDESYAATIQSITALNAETAKTEAAYYKKMCKAVSARKVFLAMTAEDRFHRQMLDRFNRKANPGEKPHSR